MLTFDNISECQTLGPIDRTPDIPGSKIATTTKKQSPTFSAKRKFNTRTLMKMKLALCDKLNAITMFCLQMQVYYQRLVQGNNIQVALTSREVYEE